MKDNKILRFSLFFTYIVAFAGIAVFIGFQQQGIDLPGTIFGFIVGIIDTLISSVILFKMETSTKKSDNVNQYSALTFGFFIRMVLMLGGGFGLEQINQYWGISFALMYLAMHFAHIGGFACYTLQKMKLESQKTNETTNVDSKSNTDTTENIQETK